MKNKLSSRSFGTGFLWRDFLLIDVVDFGARQVVAAQAWRERTARTFLRKNSYYTLVEVLSPKLDALAPNRFRKRRLKVSTSP